MSSITDKINGKTKQAVGKITGNKKLESKGKAEVTKGKMKRSMNDIIEKMPD